MYEDGTMPFRDHGIYSGLVVDNVDPLKQGRVLVTIPGIIEPAMWAEVCMPGSPFSNGMFAVPAVQAQVVVQFLDGDREQPIVMGGIAPPVAINGSRAQINAGELPKCIFIENDDWVLTLGKSGTPAPYIEIKSRPKEDGSQCRIVIDFDSQVAEINVPAAMSLKTNGLLNLDGNLMQVRGRPIQEGSEPI